MNRNEEYLELKRELDGLNAPGGSVLRAAARQRKARRSKLFLRPLAGLAAAFAVFVLLVNVSPTVAKACEGIPILGDLAEAVSFSPSLSKAVDHNYYQEVIQQKPIEGADGATISVDYVIVDQKTVSILYHLNAPATDESEYLRPRVTKPDGSEYTDFTMSYSRDDYDTDKNIRMGHCVIGFEGQVPESLLLQIEWRRITGFDESEDEDGNFVPKELHERVGEPVEFLLNLDAAMTNQGRHYNVDQTLELNGQRIRITGINVYPSYTSFSVECDPANTAWLTGMDYYLRTSDGKQVGKPDGITAVGEADTYNLSSFRTDSVFFDEPEHVTLCITGAEWIEKAAEIRLDLANKTAEGMQAGTWIEQIARKENGWEVRIETTVARQSIEQECFDPEGGSHTFGTGGVEAYTVDGEEHWVFIYELEDYLWDEVRLTPKYTHISEYDEPITVDFELK